MRDDKPTTYQDRLKGILHSDRPGAPSSNKDAEAEGAEDSCPAFGFLRGLRDSATDIEFRFRDGTSTFFPYSWMGTWRYDPSEGILLKFSGDLVYLVLIRGSNLAQPLSEGSINLTRGGLQRHRILWLREMTEEDIRQVGDTGPTIDSIEVAEFESHDALKEWLSKKAPAFVR
jgi:hypothetical protein